MLKTKVKTESTREKQIDHLTENERDTFVITDGLERIVSLIKSHEREDAKFGIGDCSSFLLDAKDIAKRLIKKLKSNISKQEPI